MSSTLAPHLPGLLAIWMLAIVSPGPAFLMVSQLAAGRSRAAALGAAVGITTLAMTYAALTLWGLGVLVMQISWLGTALRVAGAVYLVYLGLLIFMSASHASAEAPAQAPPAGDFLAGLRIGALTGASNPKAIAFFLSLFAVALPPNLTGADKGVLIAFGFAMELGWYVFVALAVSTGSLRRAYRAARRPIDRVLGAALLLLGVRLGAHDR